MLFICVYVYMCCTPVQWLHRPEEGVGSTGAGFTNHCELPTLCSFWELTVSPLGEQQVLLTSESPLQSQEQRPYSTVALGDP